MKPAETITAFDGYLAELGLAFEAIVIGGTALNLLGVITRPTKDCDILHPEIPWAIAKAAKAFAEQTRSTSQEPLRSDWLNNGPASLVPQLNQGWEQRLRLLFQGRALRLLTLDREDFLAAKLFALCDRGIDLPDCVALAPTRAELLAIYSWLEQQDTNPDWPAHVRATLSDLARRLGYGL